jgi:chromosome segregation ATPase
MARETEKLLTTRADAAQAAMAATMAARDANGARQVLERALADLLTTKEDAAQAAMAATLAAQDASDARQVLERALADLPLLADAVEALNGGLAAISERLSERQPSEVDVAAQIADLKKQLDELEKMVKKDRKKRGRPD